MRFLVILLLSACWSVTGFAQRGTSDQIILKSIRVNTDQEQLPLEEQILMIKGRTIYAAKGYKIVYSKTLKEAWFQAEGISISTDDIIAMRKKKDKKGKPQMSGMTVFCNGSHGCQTCSLVDIGPTHRPHFVCQSASDCDCHVVIIPDKKKVTEFQTSGGEWF